MYSCCTLLKRRRRNEENGFVCVVYIYKKTLNTFKITRQFVVQHLWCWKHHGT